MTSSRRIATAAMLCFAGLELAVVAAGVEPNFGPNDVPTAFYIAKSDNRNRVDYGMRLDGHCIAAKKDAVFPYWREFEKTPVRIHPLGMFEYLAYGVSTQGPLPRTSTSGEYSLKLKQVDRRIWITTSVGEDGHCKALVRATIAGVPYAQLLSIYVKLSGPLSVAYVDVKGKNLQTGQFIEERIKH